MSATSPVAAQQPVLAYHWRALDSARFVETVHSDVVAQSGSAERHRAIDRTTVYSLVLLGDTVRVTADSMTLREDDEGVIRDIDVDAVVGSRWRVIFDARGHATVVADPFVPDDIIEVSDVSTAMDDFFPVGVPVLAAGASRSDSTRRWQRLADSAGLQRLRWSYRGRMDSTRAGVDSGSAPVTGNVRDDGVVAWDRLRGPVGWNRDIDTDFDSRISGRVVRGSVRQHIVVRRIH